VYKRTSVFFCSKPENGVDEYIATPRTGPVHSGDTSSRPTSVQTVPGDAPSRPSSARTVGGGTHRALTHGDAEPQRGDGSGRVQKDISSSSSAPRYRDSSATNQQPTSSFARDPVDGKSVSHIVSAASKPQNASTISSRPIAVHNSKPASTVPDERNSSLAHRSNGGHRPTAKESAAMRSGVAEERSVDGYRAGASHDTSGGTTGGDVSSEPTPPSSRPDKASRRDPRFRVGSEGPTTRSSRPEKDLTEESLVGMLHLLPSKMSAKMAAILSCEYAFDLIVCCAHVFIILG